ncbi:MAG: hypothetical protein SFY92_03365 [Verrucomicrobiae bacterium]|nr:hypothetical protein [Verrucomicrobiae bacterium]
MFYGAAEFSRDTDLAILADDSNLRRLKCALEELQAGLIAVPPFEMKYLRKGHAIHFRCTHPEAYRMRVDIMSKMRGVAPFSLLWKRRWTIRMPDGQKCDIMGIADLICAKKTQRDKDWPMIRRLVEAHYFQNIHQPTAPQMKFWFQELRTPELLAQLASFKPALCRRIIPQRPLLTHALSGKLARLEAALAREELIERKKDRVYWLPLRRELEKLRHG